MSGNDCLHQNMQPLNSHKHPDLYGCPDCGYIYEKDSDGFIIVGAMPPMNSELVYIDIPIFEFAEDKPKSADKSFAYGSRS